jgi:hypothetical protein
MSRLGQWLDERKERSRRDGEVAAVKATLLDAVKKTRGPGRGVDIPNHDPVSARALQELLREHPELTLHQHKYNWTLCFVDDVRQTVSGGLLNEMGETHFSLKQGDSVTAHEENTKHNEEEKKGEPRG